MPSPLVVAIIAGAVAAWLGIVLLAVALCRAAALGDEMYAPRFAPAPADLDVIVEAIDGVGEEVEAVVWPERWAA